MKTFRRTLLAAFVGGCFCCLVPGRCQDFKPRIIRFGYGPQRGFQSRAAPPSCLPRKWKKASGGKMKVRAIGAASLGSDVQMQQALIRWCAGDDGGLHRHAGGHHQRDGDLGHAFPVQQRQRADVVLDGPVGQKVMDKLQEKGLVGLVYWENGCNLTNSKRPVNKLGDMDGIKLRVMQNNVFLDNFKTLGANAVPLPFSELFTALETKTVDGQENPTTPSCRASSMRCRSTSR